MGSASSSNPLKVIYLQTDGVPLKVVFNTHWSSSDVRELLCNATGLARNTSILLWDRDGAIVSIDGSLPANSPSSPYRVASLAASQPTEKEEQFQNILSQMVDQFSRALKLNDLRSEFSGRLGALEKRLEEEELKGLEIDKCKNELKRLRDELSLCHSCPSKHHKAKEPVCLKPRRDIPSYPKYTLSQETIRALKRPSFDIWHWEYNEMLSCLEYMYHDLGLVQDLNINPITLKRWLLSIQENYRNNPFHNFRHCFSVAQMMYGMIHLCTLQETMSGRDLVILMTAAICHDLDHPGYSNAYQINACTELAVRYNDICPLENHHCAVAFHILSRPECNIFGNVDPEAFKCIRQGLITLILGTDMARHGEILASFQQKINSFDFTNEEHKLSLKMVLIKCCDISNEVRPSEVADPWLDCLLEEYFIQSDREKLEGLPVAPFMDREKVTKPTAQIGFIKFVLIPTFETLTKLFPQIEEVMVEPLRAARDRYEELKEVEDAQAEKLRKKTTGGKGQRQ